MMNAQNNYLAKNPVKKETISSPEKVIFLPYNSIKRLIVSTLNIKTTFR